MSEYKMPAEKAEELLDDIDTFKPSKYPGMSYESGIQEVLMWLLGHEGRPEI